MFVQADWANTLRDRLGAAAHTTEDPHKTAPACTVAIAQWLRLGFIRTNHQTGRPKDLLEDLYAAGIETILLGAVPPKSATNDQIATTIRDRLADFTAVKHILRGVEFGLNEWSLQGDASRWADQLAAGYAAFENHFGKVG